MTDVRVSAVLLGKVTVSAVIAGATMTERITADIGDIARLPAVFEDENDVEADPTTVTLLIRRPDTQETAHVYGVDANVIQDSTGNYHYDFTFVQAGDHFFRWKGVGVVTTAEELEVRVRESAFDAP